MAIEVPSAVAHLMNLYGLPWPDVDEDGFEALQSPLRNFGNDLAAIGDDIASALQDLHSASPSLSLEAMISYFGAIRREFLDPVKQFADDLAGLPCTLTYHAIQWLKVTVIGMLTDEVANDAADVGASVMSGGVLAPEAALEAAAVREAISQTLKELESGVISILQHEATSVLDNFVSSLVNPFINQVESRLESDLASYAPHLALQATIASDDQFGVGASGSVLKLVESHLEQSVEQIGTCTSHLYTASSKLDAAIKEIFSHPQPGLPAIHSLSSVLRSALTDILDTVRSDFVSAIEELAEHVAKHFITLLEDFHQALQELDEQAARLAAAEKVASVPRMTVLSAAGVAAAASTEVLVSSGLVNAEQADNIQAQAADADSVEVVETVVASVDTNPLVTVGTAVATDGEEALDSEVVQPTVSVTVQNATSDSGVETLTVKTDVAHPHASVAQGGSETTSVSAASLEHGEPVREGAATVATGDQTELMVKHSESGPKAAFATSEAHEVSEMHVRPEEPAGIVD